MKILISILSIILFSYSLFAQSAVNKDRELQVEKNYNNEIYAAHPIFDFANISVPGNPPVAIGLDSMIGAPSFTPDLDLLIKPVAYKSNLSNSGHNGMLKFDKGTINPWHAQGGYVYSSPNYFTLHASGEYDKWKQSLIPDQNITEGNGNIGVTYYITSDLKASVDINYKNQKYGLYARQEDNAEALQNVNQFNSIGINLGIQTFRTLPSKWNMEFFLAGDKWNENNTDRTENNIEIASQLQYKSSNKLILKTAPTYSLSQSDALETAYYFSNVLQAELDYKTSSIAFGINTTNFGNSLSIWPTVNIDWRIADTDHLTFSTSQNISINSAQRISSYNPYVDFTLLPIANSSNVQLKDFYRDRNISASYKSARIPSWNFTAGASYNQIDGDQNFQLIDSRQNFNIERIDYSLLQAKLGVEYKLLEDIMKIGLDVTYNKYQNASSSLFHRPEFIVEPIIQSSLINNKLDLTLSSNINAPQLLSVENEVELKSSWRTNVSFEAKYEILKRMNIYLNADNILNDEYQQWNGYNNFGRNLSVGILLKI
ncbi:MAG: hypothetical protein ACJA01_001594 [Saprospiraceae bacterium]|jgi:hypothetical protein